MFKSKDWFLKFVILSLFNLPTAYYVSLYFENKLTVTTADTYLVMALSAIATVITFGYSARCSQNLLYLDFDNPNILPSWKGNVTDFFIIGLKKAYYNGVVYLYMIPYTFFSYKAWVTPNAGVEIALDGLFCENFEYQRCPDLNEVLDTVRGDLGKYYKLSIASAASLFLLIVVGGISIGLGVKIADIWAFTPFAGAYYLLVAAYCAGDSAQYTKTSAI